MPMKSQQQRKYLWATDPKLARKFEDHTPKGKKLPKKVKKQEKKAMIKVANGILIKESGYYQNIVGLDDKELMKLKALRKVLRRQGELEEEEYAAAMAHLKSKGFTRPNKPYNSPEVKAYLKKTEPLLSAWWKNNPSKVDDASKQLLALGSEVAPFAGKYNEIPGLLVNYATAPVSGAPTSTGYMTKSQLLNSPQIKMLNTIPAYKKDPELSVLAEKIKKSPYKYYTSTDLS